MKLSFSTLATPGISGVEAIKLARLYGYDGIDLRVSDHQGELSLAPSASEIQELREALDAEGIIASSLLCYNKVSGNDIAREADDIKRHQELAEKIGALAVRVFMEKTSGFDDNPDIASRMAEAMRIAADASPVIIQPQNHGGQLSAAECLRVIKETGRSNVRLFYSPDHCLAMGEDVAAMTRAAAEYIGHLFYEDAIVVDGSLREQPPGEGDVPWPMVFEILKESGFDGWVSFKWEKVWHPDLAGYEVSLPGFVGYMKRNGEVV